MPLLKIQHVISFSSEDPVHVANNLLGSNTSLKWKCKTKGEKSAIIYFQLEKASRITGIDLGNEHSAYIEVLVSRMGENDDFKTLLVMSSFMSATESRQSTNKNQVRMFKKEDLSQPEVNEKWDRIKVVCTQPFNKHVQYGLSMIKFHTDEAQKETNSSDKNNDLEILKPGSLFAKWKDKTSHEKPTLTAAAAIRATTSSLLNEPEKYSPRINLLPECLKKPDKTPIIQTNCDVKGKYRNELLYTEDDEKPNEKIDKVIERRREEKLKNEQAEKKVLKSPQGKKKDTPKPESSKRKLQNGTSENAVKKQKVNTYKPFGKLLEGVVLVISGIQNPDRANLREKILKMGAKYKPDWDNSCTHLVCAFTNTPKFNQVKGKGKIVTRQWIEKCFSERKKLPWRRFALDKSDLDKEESEDEIWEENVNQTLEIPQNVDETMEQASDTEDIIESIIAKNNTKFEDQFGVETESEDDENRKQFFNGKTFTLGDFETSLRKELKRYISSHGGKLCDVSDYTICKKEEVDMYKATGLCILPEWIVDCHKLGQFIAPDEYFIL